MFLLGCGTLYESAVGDKSYNHLHCFKLDVSTLLKSCGNSTKDPSTHNWDGLQPSIRILEIIEPDVAIWIKEKHDSGKLVIQSGVVDKLACYNGVTGNITIFECLFAEDDLYKACVIGHEYRHSKQNFMKAVRRVLAQVFRNPNYLDFVETDAEQFELELKLIALGYKK